MEMHVEVAMVTLVLCIDRDDDLGRKTGRVSPIISRSANLEAAVALGLADPGESDTNTMFKAIRTYDKLRNEGHDVEVATLCGDIRVGDRSDMKIAKQLDHVIQTTGADSAVLVTDGSEDAYITPIIASRLKINATHRVYIKQAPNIESTYYTIRAMLDDPKIQASLFPIVLVLAALALISLYQESLIIGTILLIPSLYFLIRYFKLEETLVTFTGDAFTGMASKVTIVTGIIALGIIVYGLVYGLDAANAIQEENEESGTDNGPLEPLLVFVSSEGILLPLLVGMWILEFGRVIRDYLKEHRFKVSFVVFTFMLAAVGLIVSGVVDLLHKVFVDESEIELADIFTNFMMGIMAALLGAALLNYVRNQADENDDQVPVADWQE